MHFTSITDPAERIQGVEIRKLKLNSDPRGHLVEILRVDWHGFFHPATLPFRQCYYSVTKPWVARDEKRWHIHQKQMDRLVVVEGEIALALFDTRSNSPTTGKLNLFRLTHSSTSEDGLIVLVPKRVHHAFLAVGPDPAILVNFPTRLYDPTDEGRVPFEQDPAHFSDGDAFAWDIVREYLRGR